MSYIDDENYAKILTPSSNSLNGDTQHHNNKTLRALYQ